MAIRFTTDPPFTAVAVIVAGFFLFFLIGTIASRMIFFFLLTATLHTFCAITTDHVVLETVAALRPDTSYDAFLILIIAVITADWVSVFGEICRFSWFDPTLIIAVT